MQQAVDTPPQGSTMTTTTGPSEVGTTAAPQPPIGRYRRVPVQVHQADPDAPEGARHLTAPIPPRWPAPAPAPTHSPATTKALIDRGFQPQVPAAFPATRPMLWGTFRHRVTEYRVH